ncbi:uncharacterized protein ACA1_167000 [Acanthamoeba castellanii str. Neff]|uniref:Uncharacterized protein n=1 Tax=Acanthamoeba castellanii (strain ATCC 30010 / Neff) TaxID=1257118 RepID=L8H0S0_ACACF|nr:uncharacterized protein ACA1_167000 [Acanthamoeba castellanii str. Neff]ELR18840.1 hypothetical protein ACA1_167000 [Acanthamoeba castellanii str. Neff]
MAEEKEGQEELLFQDLLKEDSEDAEGKPKRPSRAWPPLPPGYALPSDPQELKCYNFFELWGQCAAPSWWLRNFYRDGSVGFNCQERWENLQTCVLLKFRKYDQAKRELRDIREQRERKKGPHVWDFRQRPPAYFKKFDYPPDQPRPS